MLVDAVISALLILVVRGRLLYQERTTRPNLIAFVPVLLVGLGLWQNFPSSEYIIGGKDPGTYMNEGIQIAQRGTILPTDPVVASVPAEERRLFFPSHRRPTYYGLRFMGFFIIDPAQGTVLGQFPHLYPVSIAFGYALNGLSGARQTVGVWAILGVLSVYFAARRLTGWLPAGAAATLLALNIVQVWFARYPNAEVVMQALLFAALLAGARAHVDGDRFFGPIMAVLVLQLLFLRYDAVLALGAMGASLVLGFLVRRRLPWSGILILGAGLILWWMYLTERMAPYSTYPLRFIDNLGAFRFVLLALMFGLLAAVAAVVRSDRIAIRTAARLPIVIGWLVAVLAIYAYCFRQPGGRIAFHDATAIHAFTWYSTRVGLLAGVIGLLLLIRRSFWRDPAFLLTGIIYAIFFFFKLRIVPMHFWVARRFLPVILPIALVAAAYLAFRAFESGPFGVSEVSEWRRRKWALKGGRAGLQAIAVLGGLILIGWMGWQFVQATNAVRQHVEYAGLIPRIEQLASRFGQDDLLIVESRTASDMHVLALPLAYIYAKNVLVLNAPRPDKQLFGQFLGHARARYKEIYFLGGGGTDLLSRTIAASPVASDRFQVPEYESTRNQYPTRVRMKEFDFGIYRFVKPAPSPPWFALDIGTLDDLNVARFHAKERSGDVTFRWTHDVSYISVVGIRSDARLVTLWLNDGKRPSTIPAARVAVSFDDTLLGEAEVTSGFNPYSFAIPPSAAQVASNRDEPTRIRIAVNPWNPKDALGTSDDRVIGVMVDRVEVR